MLFTYEHAADTQVLELAHILRGSDAAEGCDCDVPRLVDRGLFPGVALPATVRAGNRATRQQGDKAARRQGKVQAAAGRVKIQIIIL